jgi:hypothetical protein
MTLSRPDLRSNKYPAAFSNFYDCFFEQLYQHPDSVDYLNAIYEPTISRVDLHGMFSKLLSLEEGKHASEDGGGGTVNEEVLGNRLSQEVISIASDICEGIYRTASQVPRYIRAALKIVIDNKA